MEDGRGIGLHWFGATQGLRRPGLSKPLAWEKKGEHCISRPLVVTEGPLLPLPLCAPASKGRQSHALGAAPCHFLPQTLPCPRASGTHLCKKLGALKGTWGPSILALQVGPMVLLSITASDDSHENPGRMLVSGSHPAAMLSSAGALFGSCTSVSASLHECNRKSRKHSPIKRASHEGPAPWVGTCPLVYFPCHYSLPPRLPGAPWGRSHR